MVSGQLMQTKSDFGQEGVEVDHLHAQVGGLGGRDIGIVGQQASELERPQHSEQLGADVADTDRTERTPGDSQAGVVALVAPTPGADEPIFDHHVFGKPQQQRDDALGHRHGARRHA